MADLIASSIATTATGNAAAERQHALRLRPSPDVSGGVKHVPSARHASYLHLPAYRKAAASMRSEMGWAGFDAAPLELAAWHGRAATTAA